MKGKELYIVLLLVVIGLTDGVCQNGDSLLCDSGMYAIYLNCIPTFNNIPLDNGDIINVASTTADIDAQTNSIAYLKDSANTISFADENLVDHLPGVANIAFSVRSQSENCLSAKVQYVADEANSSACALSITALKAEYHQIEYLPGIICTGDMPVSFISDIPGDDFRVIANSPGIMINDSGEIVPRESIPGYYVVHFSSDYCLAVDSLSVEIAASPDLALADTLSVCRGNSVVNSVPEMDNIYFYDAESNEIYNSGELAASGAYLALADEGPCSSIDTVYINLIDAPEIRWDIRDECDRVIVNTIIPSARDYEVSWSNTIEGPENIVYNDTMLTVDVKDESGCISRDSIAIAVKRLSLESVDYLKEEADCWKEGQVVINSGTVESYVGNYRYRLYNRLTNRLLSDLSDVPEGVYSLQVVDDRDCVAEYKQTVKVEQKCLEDYPAFSPNGDNVEDTYFIPYEGTVSIYDRNGVLLRELETPAYWDGTDAQNRPLPMGNYLLVTEAGRSVNITIIR